MDRSELATIFRNIADAIECESEEGEEETPPAGKRGRKAAKKAAGKRGRKPAGPTLDEIRDIAKPLIQGGWGDDVSDILAEFDVTTVSELDPSQYADCYAKLKEYSELDG